jgi:hypothetical protein
MTENDWKIYQIQKSVCICYLCKAHNNNLVKDHDHFTGHFLGLACNQCNLARRLLKKPTLPIVFHNLKGIKQVSYFKIW